MKHFMRDVITYTPLLRMVMLLLISWLVFAALIYHVESGTQHSTITSYGNALYWCVAAFSTAGIADTPQSGLGQLIGGIWIVFGSMLFFGAIVATVTAYFMRPMQRPGKRIIDTIEYNLEQLDDLTVEELDLLRSTVDTLIGHMERVKKKQEEAEGGQP